MAIRLNDDGCGVHVIAVALDIADDEVATLLQIARTKLANLMASDGVRPARA